MGSSEKSGLCSPALGVVPSERKCDGEGDSPFALGACKSL